MLLAGPVNVLMLVAPGIRARLKNIPPQGVRQHSCMAARILIRICHWAVCGDIWPAAVLALP
jgi:hypothetical protein